MKGYLLDTNVIIKFLEGNKAARQIIEAIPDRDLYISVVTVAEYWQGSYRLKQPETQINLFNTFIEKGPVSVLEISTDIARTFGKLQGLYSGRGYPKPIFDLMLAATCLTHDLTIVTFNQKNFETIEGVQLYKTV